MYHYIYIFTCTWTDSNTSLRTRQQTAALGHSEFTVFEELNLNNKMVSRQIIFAVRFTIFFVNNTLYYYIHLKNCSVNYQQAHENMSQNKFFIVLTDFLKYSHCARETYLRNMNLNEIKNLY
jgi:hypothetical protein